QIGMAPPAPPRAPAPPAGVPAPGVVAPVPPVPPLDAVEVRPGRVVVRKGDGGREQDVRIEVVRVGSDGSSSPPAPPMPPMPPMPPLMLHGNTLPVPYGMHGK